MSRGGVPVSWGAAVVGWGIWLGVLGVLAYVAPVPAPAAFWGMYGGLGVVNAAGWGVLWPRRARRWAWGPGLGAVVGAGASVLTCVGCWGVPGLAAWPGLAAALIAWGPRAWWLAAGSTAITVTAAVWTVWRGRPARCAAIR
jgi:hypothetical protein